MSTPGATAGHAHDSVVIGAGQAGLSASYHLTRLGIGHVVLDANDTPGGAWQHRWDALTMRDVHGVAELPGSAPPPLTRARANEAIPAYFAGYEAEHELPIVRPVRVDRVTDEAGILTVHAGDRLWRSRTLVNATGTWTQPFIPHYPGAARVPWRTVPHCRVPWARALPRQAHPRRWRRRVCRAVPRCDRAAH